MRELQRQADVARHRRPRHQRRLLEHEADLAACGAAMSPAPRHCDRCRCVGSVRPAISRSAVDLPQPEGPSSVTNSPGRTSRLKRSSATTPLAKILRPRERDGEVGSAAGMAADSSAAAKGLQPSHVPRATISNARHLPQLDADALVHELRRERLPPVESTP